MAAREYSNEQIAQCVDEARKGGWKRLKLDQVETTDQDLALLVREPGIESVDDLFLEESPSEPLLSEKNILALVSTCPNLRSLHIGWCGKLTDKGVDAMLQSRRKLERLSIVYGDRLSDEMLVAIARHCQQLVSLSVSDYGPPFTDKGMAELAKIGGRLETLSIEDCGEVHDAGLAALAKGCPELRSLNLSRCKGITDAGLAALARDCPKLQNLNTAVCAQYTDVGFAALAAGCPDLRSLTVERCRGLGDGMLLALAKGCPELRSLDVTDCAITDRGMAALAKGCTRLEKLHFGKGVTDTGLIAIANGCRQLKDLQILGGGITEIGFVALGSECRQLESLFAGGCEEFTDTALMAIGRGCPELRKLEIGGDGCPNVTDVGLAAIAQGCAHLQILDLMNCQQITAKTLASLAQGCRELEVLTIADCRQIRDLAPLASLFPQAGGRLKSLITIRCKALYKRYGQETIDRCDIEAIYRTIQEEQTKPGKSSKGAKPVRSAGPDIDAFRRRIRDALVQEKFAEQAEELADASEGFVLLDTGDNVAPDPLPTGASRFGGLPDLPPEIAWPELDGKKIPFVAQIDLSALPHWRGSLLPPEGWLYVFALMGEAQFKTVVLHHRGPREALKQVMPQGSIWSDWSRQSIYECIPLVSRLGWGMEGRRFHEIMLQYRNDRRVMDYTPESITFIAKAWEPAPAGTRVAGWLLGNVSGLDGTTEQLAEISKCPGQGWVSLLAVGSVGTMSWSDSGTLYVLIKREDLAKGDFSKVALTWASS